MIELTILNAIVTLWSDEKTSLVEKHTVLVESSTGKPEVRIQLTAKPDESSPLQERIPYYQF